MIKVQVTVGAVVRITFASEDICLNAVIIGFTIWEGRLMDLTPTG